MSRNKFLLPLFLAAFGVCSYCHAALWSGIFMTTGPDKYADGTTVSDGAYYAIVWRDADKTFAGFKQGITLEGTYNGLGKTESSALARQSLLVDTVNSQLVYAKAMATNGCMPALSVNFRSDRFKTYKNGVFSVYLLDARSFGTPIYEADGTVSTNISKQVSEIQGYVEAAAVAYVSGKVDETVEGSVAGKTYLLSTIDQKTIPSPVITKIRLEDEYVVLSVRSTVSSIAYNAVSADTMSNAKDQIGVHALAPVGGAEKSGDEIEIRVPRKKDAQNEFFSIIRNPLN